MNLEQRDGVLPVEEQLAALLAAGHSRTRATELVTEQATADAIGSPTVVLVEGLSDQIVVEIVALRRGRRLRDEGVAVVPMGGATNIGRFLGLFRDARLGGLYDSGEHDHFVRVFQAAGIGSDLESLGFFACVRDIEDELIRSLGTARIEEIIEAEGRLKSFRTMQNEPAHRSRSLEQHLYRFIGSNRYRYARLLAEALDPAGVPTPLDRLLTYVGH